MAKNFKYLEEIEISCEKAVIGRTITRCMLLVVLSIPGEDGVRSKDSDERHNQVAVCESQCKTMAPQLILKKTVFPNAVA